MWTVSLNLLTYTLRWHDQDGWAPFFGFGLLGYYSWRLIFILIRKKPTRCTMPQIYLIKYSTCFGQVHCPSSGVSQHCAHAIGIRHASSVGCLLAWSEWSSIPTTLADANRTSMANTYGMCTVLRYSWSWAVDLSETRRVLYQINMRNCASRSLLL